MPVLGAAVNDYLSSIAEFAMNPAGDTTVMLGQLNVIEKAFTVAFSTADFAISLGTLQRRF
jgi:hypothetical protein